MDNFWITTGKLTQKLRMAGFRVRFFNSNTTLFPSTDQLHSTIHGRPVRCCEWNKLEVARYRDLGPPIGGNSNNNQIGTAEF